VTNVERAARVAAVRFDLTDPRSSDAQQTMTRYFDELNRRFRYGFDPGHGGAGGDAALLRAPGGAFVVVHDDNAPIGCGGVQRVDDVTAEIKRMWIDPESRGLGLGPRLLARLEAVAEGLGYRRVVLDTNESLTEAIAMYERAGYTAIERYNDNRYAHHWFAKDLSAHTGESD
jgi:GNAT superfamily N-acetyltransferase